MLCLLEDSCTLVDVSCLVFFAIIRVVVVPDCRFLGLGISSNPKGVVVVVVFVFIVRRPALAVSFRN